MRRRTVLSGLAVSLPLALAGCTGDSGPDDPGGTDTTDEQSETETPSDEPDTPDGTVTPGRVSATLVPREECPNPGEATVSFGDEAISVVGCVVGNNGCNVQRLQEVDYDTETEALTVVVAAVEEREEDEACTEALVNLGYEVDIETDGTSVTSVRVVHDDVDGRRTVVDVTR
ncbi:hypothetical protein [Halobellus litoreus]|uniref:Uncharacterized protein n=1 Tax=Halobellus litoreus TaxID=755310 RepID=A0ABD6DTM1_9EURY|nr:hypothetical protein [Halobellus litoreus]